MVSTRFSQLGLVYRMIMVVELALREHIELTVRARPGDHAGLLAPAPTGEDAWRQLEAYTAPGLNVFRKEEAAWLLSTLVNEPLHPTDELVFHALDYLGLPTLVKLLRVIDRDCHKHTNSLVRKLVTTRNSAAHFRFLPDAQVQELQLNAFKACRALAACSQPWSRWLGDWFQHDRDPAEAWAECLALLDSQDPDYGARAVPPVGRFRSAVVKDGRVLFPSGIRFRGGRRRAVGGLWVWARSSEEPPPGARRITRDEVEWLLEPEIALAIPRDGMLSTPSGLLLHERERTKAATFRVAGAERLVTWGPCVRAPTRWVQETP